MTHDFVRRSVAELGGEFGAGADAEFGVDVGEVELDGFDADEEF
jgi:hypothetical protein